VPKKNNLLAYKKKRNFKVTKEPSGRSKKTKKNNKFSFVIQQHHARRLHYDFRLEWEGVLKSWALPKGPSKIAGEKRLAVQTEDHPLEYGKFKGTIPTGEYGAGEVFIWDKGTWEPIGNPELSFKKGHIDFKLKGKKLTGTWSLIRTHLGKTENNWLLIKKKDELNINSQITDPWPGIISPQLPRLVSEPPLSSDWIHEIKFDGYRIHSHLRDGICHLYTRSGLDWSNAFPHVLNELSKLKIENAIFDGEIVALDEEGRSHFQLLQNTFKSKKDKGLVFYIFDLLYLNGRDLRNLPLVERKQFLKKIIPKNNQILIYSEHFEDAKEFFKLSCKLELEGIVSKNRNSSYKSGRSDLWMKSKCTHRQEFVIAGYTKGEGARSDFGSLILGLYEGDNFNYVGKVGTGFSQVTIKELKKLIKRFEAKSSPFTQKKRIKNAHWLKPELVCEVSFANWTNENLLRAPVFKGLRSDKSQNEVLHEKISSPEKILFKQEKITKKMVNEYYQKVSDLVLPFIKNRPLSLVRCPEGTDFDCFYQKHFNSTLPKSFHTVRVKEEKGFRKYISISSPKGLNDLVQLNAFEIHAWNCHDHDLVHPDQFVIDLDPGTGVTWSTIIAAAFEFKMLLEDLGLESFVKLTGGKGLHIHVPIMPKYSWDDVKLFTQSLALEMESRSPGKFTTKMFKDLRRGKIFIDYLRNSFGATAVVPYSLRASKKTSVALPVRWNDLKKIKNSKFFSLKRALSTLKRRRQDPWEKMYELNQLLDPLELKKAA
jgi:bifunctional non-homologous end joining protein LigD